MTFDKFGRLISLVNHFNERKKGRRFKKSFFGYSPDQVDVFLAVFERTLYQCLNDSKEVSDLNDTEEIKKDAVREAFLMKNQAKEEALQIVEEVEFDINRLLQKRQDLLSQLQVFRTEFKLLMGNQISEVDVIYKELSSSLESVDDNFFSG